MYLSKANLLIALTESLQGTFKGAVLWDLALILVYERHERTRKHRRGVGLKVLCSY